MEIRRILFSFCFLLTVCHSSTAEDEKTTEQLIKSLEKCKANGFGKTNFVCDADELLDAETRRTVEKKLRHLRSKAECLCENREDCYLYKKEAVLRAGVFVLNNFPPSVDSLTLSRQLYNRSGLSASATCPNGLLIVFSKQLAKAHTIRDWPSYRLNVSPFNRTASADSEKENGTVLVSFIPAAVETRFYYSPASIQFVLGAVVAVAILLLVLALVCGLVCTLPCMNELKEIEREGELKEQFEQFEAVKLGSAPEMTPIYDVPPPTVPPITALTKPIYVTTTAVSISEQPESRSPSSGGQLPPALFMDPNRSVETQKKQAFLY